jgi:hypothetical protein
MPSYLITNTEYNINNINGNERTKSNFLLEIIVKLRKGFYTVNQDKKAKVNVNITRIIELETIILSLFV